MILSATPIPGNERYVYDVINMLYRKGATVINDTIDRVHVSGHACEEELKLGGCPTGQAKITSGYNLKAKYVIHTPGPVWQGGDANEAGLLADCYNSCLRLARDNGLKTVCFPSISTGVYRFPLSLAADIAIHSILVFFNGTPGYGSHYSLF